MRSYPWYHVAHLAFFCAKSCCQGKDDDERFAEFVIKAIIAPIVIGLLLGLVGVAGVYLTL